MLTLAHSHLLNRRRIAEVDAGAGDAEAASSAAAVSSSIFPAAAASSSSASSSSSSSKKGQHPHSSAGQPNAKRQKKSQQPEEPAKKTPEQKARERAFKEKLAKYSSAQGAIFGANEIKATTNSKLKKEMRLADEAKKKSAEAAARAEILLPASSGVLVAEGQDRTWRVTQDKLKPELDVRTQAKMFDLKLDGFGPYQATYTRNGRYMLLAGRKGHVALMNWHTFGLESEMHVKEQINDIKFLHNETMYAVAQKKYVYIYDRTGMELHCLRNMYDVNCLEFLPYHFLLASIGATGYLKYQDTSTGQFLCEYRTKLGDCHVMKQNPSNAVLCLGHSNGTITMWTPNMAKPVVTMKTHRASVAALGMDIGGNMLVTSGVDGQVKIWDCRTYRELHSYFTVRPTTTIDISDQGLLALGYGPHVQVWKDAFRTKQNSPYMYQQLSGKIVKSVEFVPYEDVLGVGHSAGFSSLVIPGAGEANFDSYEANPFQTNKQRRESTVHSLLEKLQPDMITLERQMFGMMSKSSKVVWEGERKEVREKREQQKKDETMEVNKKRGKSKSSKKLNRKNSNIIDAARMERAETAQKTQQQIVARKKEEERVAEGRPHSALDRFGR